VKKCAYATSFITPMVLCCAAVALSVGNASAQQSQRQVSFKVQESKFIVSQNIDVGDVPNHQVRLFDTHLILPNPTVNGLKLVEAFVRGTADYTGLVGSGVGYQVFVADTGDKIFTRNTLSIQPNRENKETSTTLWVGHITGGTGQFKGIEGTVRQVVNVDPRPGGTIGDNQIDIEYTFEHQGESGGTAHEARQSGGITEGARQSGGTPEEARAMLNKAVAAVKTDRDLALGMFNKGEGGFRDRDLYPFCVRIRDGRNVAGPLYTRIGTNARTVKDSTGKRYGLQQLAAEQKPEGQITEVTYMAPKPGTTAPEFQKVSLMTKVGDLICGVGYYK
jgi:hypothetical protein